MDSKFEYKNSFEQPNKAPLSMILSKAVSSAWKPIPCSNTLTIFPLYLIDPCVGLVIFDIISVK